MIHEAVSNALKHAHPSHISIQINATTSGLQMVVTDDGQGFAFRGRLEHEELARANIGPVSLRERGDAQRTSGGGIDADGIAGGDRDPDRRPRRVAGSGLDEALLLRAERQLEPSIHAELLVDVVQVRLDRAF